MTPAEPLVKCIGRRVLAPYFPQHFPSAQTPRTRRKVPEEQPPRAGPAPRFDDEQVRDAELAFRRVRFERAANDGIPDDGAPIDRDMPFCPCARPEEHSFQRRFRQARSGVVNSGGERSHQTCDARQIAASDPSYAEHATCRSEAWALR